MKSVLISIKPKWCELIASGKKTIEVRKTRPKIDTPFKCYIYCTMGDVIKLEGHRTKATKITFWLGKPLNNISPGRYTGNGMVIGEFVCDEIEHFTKAFFDEQEERDTEGIAYLLEGSCLSYSELCNYVKLDDFYGWNISDLKIYDKPRELSEFTAMCKFKNDDGSCQTYKVDCPYQKYDYNQDGSINLVDCGKRLTRPPQSYMFVEELQ